MPQYVLEYILLCAGMFLLFIGVCIALIAYADFQFKKFQAAAQASGWKREVDTLIVPVVKKIIPPVKHKWGEIRKNRLRKIEDYPAWILH
jgi:uncharacterized membrane protein YdjX (TVP38/TMEM64 family)